MVKACAVPVGNHSMLELVPEPIDASLLVEEQGLQLLQPLLLQAVLSPQLLCDLLHV